ncbi:MAG: methenyltetrahydromethanopterin cyclohydrolase [Gammaproteobacteria bacterium]|nr:methenyltetrahydromethanopterin cyclohydrolase [Gammaproteobacteria bacterium]
MPLSVNACAEPLVRQLIDNASQLRVEVSQQDNGCTVVDAGIDAQGGLEAGVLIARICMADLGSVKLSTRSRFKRWPWHVEVTTSQPVTSCLASQYAGWGLDIKGENKFFALGSGPARALALKELLFKDLNYKDSAQSTCLVLETDKFPPEELAQKITHDCNVDNENLTLILTPTGSLAGVVQISARVVEVALHKTHELDFPLDNVVDGAGITPLPPPSKDSLQAMGRTNDTILFGGDVHLFVNGPDDDAQDLANRLPSSASRDYGKPFSEVFKEYDYDFFKVDPMLFSPARVSVTALQSGNTFVAGELNEALLERSFFGE